MIYITGDTHADLDILKTFDFCETHHILPSDYLIICGDFGGVWDGGALDKYIQGLYEEQPWTILFVSGNHENHDLLDQYPVSEWCGGRIHRINDQIFHLMRGQVYTIEGHTFFTMGGAESADKIRRKEGLSWWAREMPSNAEYVEAMANLARHGNMVDYIVTHCAPDSIQDELSKGYYEHNKLTNYLEIVRQTTTFKHWYFGHYHQDKDWINRYSCLYDRVVELG